MKINCSIQDLLALTAVIALLFALPVELLQIVLMAAILIFAIVAPVIYPSWLAFSRRAEHQARAERFFNHVMVRAMAYSGLVIVFGFAAIACKQPVIG